MLAEEKAVVGRDDERGILPKIVLVEIIEELAEEKVAHRDDRIVVCAKLLAFFRKLVDAPIARPVADGPGPAGVERSLEARRGMERLVWVEGLDLEEPAIGILVALQKLESMREALHGRKVLLVLDELA